MPFQRSGTTSKWSIVAPEAQSDIAAALALPLGTVKSRMRLAYKKLRIILEDVR